MTGSTCPSMGVYLHSNGVHDDISLSTSGMRKQLSAPSLSRGVHVDVCSVPEPQLAEAGRGTSAEWSLLFF
jgi:hypothetical protein